MITLLTPTGGRPESFAKCQDQMEAQTYDGPVRWVIVDDGAQDTPVRGVRDWDLVVVRTLHTWQPGDNTLGVNLLYGLPQCTDTVVFIEDDDLYEPWWVQACVDRLQDRFICGEAPSLYRHVNGGEKLMGNTRHASLCCTAIRGAMAADALAGVCRKYTTGIDMHLWEAIGAPKDIFPAEPRGVVGLKGGPGRAGIGCGHRMRYPE